MNNKFDWIKLCKVTESVVQSSGVACNLLWRVEGHTRVLGQFDSPEGQVTKNTITVAMKKVMPYFSNLLYESEIMTLRSLGMDK